MCCIQCSGAQRCGADSYTHLHAVLLGDQCWQPCNNISNVHRIHKLFWKGETVKNALQSLLGRSPGKYWVTAIKQLHQSSWGAPAGRRSSSSTSSQEQFGMAVLPPLPPVADRRGILAVLWFYLPACTLCLLQGQTSVSAAGRKVSLSLDNL